MKYRFNTQSNIGEIIEKYGEIFTDIVELIDTDNNEHKIEEINNDNVSYPKTVSNNKFLNVKEYLVKK